MTFCITMSAVINYQTIFIFNEVKLCIALKFQLKETATTTFLDIPFKLLIFFYKKNLCFLSIDIRWRIHHFSFIFHLTFSTPFAPKYALQKIVPCKHILSKNEAKFPDVKFDTITRTHLLNFIALTVYTSYKFHAKFYDIFIIRSISLTWLLRTHAIPEFITIQNI